MDPLDRLARAPRERLVGELPAKFEQDGLQVIAQHEDVAIWADVVEGRATRLRALHRSGDDVPILQFPAATPQWTTRDKPRDGTAAANEQQAKDDYREAVKDAGTDPGAIQAAKDAMKQLYQAGGGYYICLGGDGGCFKVDY
jgi:hypothetical protein